MITQFLQEAVSGILLSPWVIGPVIALLWLVILLPAKKWRSPELIVISRAAPIGFGQIY